MEKDDLRYTLDRLYECRNLEISNLWQRSVFLSVFLILCFTAYGYLGLEIISKFLDKAKDLEKQLLLSSICLFIALVGSLFSIIWILMAKGSKAWYEVYESAITTFENTHSALLKLPKDNIMGNMVLEKNRKSRNIFSTKAGGYSPSRLNIAIGQISLILWIIFIAVHTYFNFSNTSISNPYCKATILFLVVGLVVSLFIIFGKYLRSNFL
jgi:bacitracin transport system permease protein